MPSVLEVLWRRKATGSEPGKRRDGFNLVLVAEGGGMRGCITAGMGAALSTAALHFTHAQTHTHTHTHTHKHPPPSLPPF